MTVSIEELAKASDVKDYPDYPGWKSISCGCCNGLEWGGYDPRECTRCNGCGIVALHIKTGLLAIYPGGPFCGRF